MRDLEGIVEDAGDHDPMTVRYCYGSLVPCKARDGPQNESRPRIFRPRERPYWEAFS